MLILCPREINSLIRCQYLGYLVNQFKDKDFTLEEQISRSAFSCASLATVTIEDSNELLEFVVNYGECRAFLGPIENFYLGRNVGCYHSPIFSSKAFNLTIGSEVTILGSGVFSSLAGIKFLIQTRLLSKVIKKD